VYSAKSVVYVEIKSDELKAADRLVLQFSQTEARRFIGLLEEQLTTQTDTTGAA